MQIQYFQDGIHEPIIDLETWNKVQVIPKERSKKHNTRSMIVNFF